MRFFLLLLKFTAVLSVLCGCYSGYIPVTKGENEPSNARADRAIQNRNCIISIGLIDSEKDTSKYIVDLSFHPVNGASPKISGIKLNLKNISDRGENFTLHTVRTYQGLMRLKDRQHRIIFDSSSKEFIPIILSPDNRGAEYSNFISYEFFDATIKEYPRRLQANFELDIEENGMVETVKDSIVFKRFHALHLTH